MINVIYTLAGNHFKEWTDELVNKRHKEIAEKRDMFIELDPEIAAIFNKS